MCEGWEVGSRFGLISRRTIEAKPQERNISTVFHPSITPGAVREGVWGLLVLLLIIYTAERHRGVSSWHAAAAAAAHHNDFDRMKQTGRVFLILDWNQREPDWGVWAKGEGISHFSWAEPSGAAWGGADEEENVFWKSHLCQTTDTGLAIWQWILSGQSKMSIA